MTPNKGSNMKKLFAFLSLLSSLLFAQAAVDPVLLSNKLVMTGDGTSTSVAVVLASAPIVYNDPNMSSTFSLLATRPSSVYGLTASSGQVVTVSYNSLTGVATFTWPTALASGAYDVLTMHFKF